MARLTEEDKARLRIAVRDMRQASSLMNVSEIPANLREYKARINTSISLLQRAKIVLESFS